MKDGEVSRERIECKPVALKARYGLVGCRRRDAYGVSPCGVSRLHPIFHQKHFIDSHLEAVKP